MKYLSLFVFLFFATAFFASGQEKQPHIIFIITDQQRADALGCMGNTAVVSPNIDKLADAGATFVNAYSSVPSCTPARAGLLTGLSPWHHGMLGYGKVARKYKYEMPRMLREAGYYTFGIGKMHWFPQKALHGFHGTLVDESGRVEQDGFVSDYRDWFKLQAPGEDPDKTGIGWNEHRSGVYQLDEKLHPTYWTGQTAIELIENYDQEKPLFLKVSFARPHSPYDPPQRFLDMYKDVQIPEPYLGEWDGKYEGLDGGKDAAFGDFGIEHAVESRRHYYASITFIDEMVGKLIQTLKEKGMYDNALICFTSDHGDMMGDHYHWRKTYAYEGSSNVPFVVKWPESIESKIEAGSKLEAVTELRDFLPTFLDAAGEKIPEEMDGLSVLNLIKNPQSAWREYIDLEHATTYSEDNYWCALTDGTWKYIWFFRTGEEQLFNLKADPGEQHDLSSENTGEVESWRQKMVNHLSERGDGFVKDGKLVQRSENLVYSPNYPADDRSSNELKKDWLQIYMGVD
ncbi:arylsulfatase [Draconibacterium sp. IB214405]|uniref:arylsulfatase n=1 Tax=Draconibacterium sp. IB214405 TaxID=3097352 RepID=UPI002A134F4D|nr:arylsulfatase [Draconibacterium sp. IB214405]MDX8339142.1 arylsulfatase [Draconibacterium sp. IB214405]